LPLVTVAIPFYNVEAWLADAVRSVFAQTLEDWELLLADDGSTDRSLEIARSIQDPRVKVVSDGRNIGRARRRNSLIGLAEGKYLAWLDADDLMHPHRLEKQLALLQADDSIDVVDSAIYCVSEGKPVGIRNKQHLVVDPAIAIRSCLICQGSTTGRTDWFRKNPFDETLQTCEDFELWVRTAACSRFARIYQPLCFVREVSVPAIDYLKKYLNSCRDVRRIIKRYGRELVGARGMTQLIAASYAKAIVYCLFTMLGMQQKLTASRGSPLTAEQWLEACSVVERIRSTRLPCRDH